MFKLQALDHVALSVRDVNRSAQWYNDVFGFSRQHDGRWNGVPVFVGRDGISIALFPLRETAAFASNNPQNGARILHFAMRADRQNFLAAQEALKKRGIPFEFQDHEISHSIYFRDPDSHELEITTYVLR